MGMGHHDFHCDEWPSVVGQKGKIHDQGTPYKILSFSLILKNRFLAAAVIGILIGMILLSFGVITANYPPLDGFVLPNGKLLGGDFIAFYNAGRMSISEKELLYNFTYQKDSRSRILGSAAGALDGELPFVHPPLVAWMFSWLASFSFDKAFYCWLSLSLIISMGSLLLLSYELRILNWDNLPTLLLGIFGFVPYLIECLMGGQLASIGILIYSLLFIFLQRGKLFLAGLIASLAYYKPPYFLLMVIALIFSQGKYFILGFLLGALTLTANTVWYIGFVGFKSFLTAISHYRYGQELMEGVKLPFTHGMGLYSPIKVLVSSPWSDLLFIALFCLFVTLAIRALRLSSTHKNESFNIAYVFTVTSSLALSFQLAKYDLSILLVTFLILAAQPPFSNGYLKWIGIVIFAFYLEFNFRENNISGLVFHASSFLFIPYLLFIFLYLRSTTQSQRLGAGRVRG